MNPRSPQDYANSAPGSHPGPQFVAPAVIGWGSQPALGEPGIPDDVTTSSPAPAQAFVPPGAFRPENDPAPAATASSKRPALLFLGAVSTALVLAAIPGIFVPAWNLAAMMLALAGLVFGAAGIVATVVRPHRWGALAVVGSSVSIAVMLTMNSVAASTPRPTTPLMTAVPMAPVVAPPSEPTEEPRAIPPLPLGSTVRLTNIYGGGQGDVTFVEFADRAAPVTAQGAAHPGMRYVAARLRIRSVGADTFRLEPRTRSSILTPAGALYGAVPSTTSAGPSMLNPIALPPGRVLDGWLTFEVPNSASLGLLQLEDAQWMFGK